MPLLLRLDNVDSLPDGGPVRFEVNRRGLDIGRDAYLDWTLPDPERFISGKHCEVRYRDGAYWLHDVSTNGTTVNGRGGRLTEPHRLEDGDRIHIGSYIVAVELHGEKAAPATGSAGAGADPWGGVADAAETVDRRDFANRARANAIPAASRGPADLAEENISWGVGKVSQSQPATDDDIWGAPPPSGGGKAGGDEWGWTPPTASGGGGRSDAVDPDWRAELARQRPEPARPAAPQPAAPEPAETQPKTAAAEPGPTTETQPPPPDDKPALAADKPAPETSAPAAEKPTETARPAAEPPASDSRAAEPSPAVDRPAPQADPFASRAGSAAPEPPAAPELAPGGATPPRPAPESDRPAPQNNPFSDLTDAAAAGPAPAEQPARPSPTPPSAPPQAASAQPAPEPSSPPREPAAAAGLASRWADGDDAAPQPQPAPPRAPAGSAGQGGDFIAAFERGAGMPAGAVTDRAGEAFAEELGSLFKLVTQNLQAMLAARAETKSAMRSSERTMIGALENNPLKFSPTPEDAMRIMFGARSRSYLDATKTVEASFGDLQKHQMQTFGAMQQALQALIEDLDPKNIEEATSKDGGLAGIVGSRRAKFWDTYVERFRAKSGRHERGMIDAFMILFAEMYDRQR